MNCGSSIVPILFTILCCAGLFIFLNSRLIEVKTTVEKQNRVLTAFITNVQHDLRGGGPPVPPKMAEASKHFATPEALMAARKQEMEKIVVSDDEEDDDSDSDSESESDSEDEADRLPVTFEVLSFINLQADTSAAGTGTSSAIESSITEVTEDSLENDIEDLTQQSSKGGEDLAKGSEEQSSKSSEELNYDQMRVDDLRKIVSDKNLASKDDVKKLKKPELLVLLKK